MPSKEFPVVREVSERWVKAPSGYWAHELAALPRCWFDVAVSGLYSCGACHGVLG
jgi:hypothetical protein